MNIGNFLLESSNLFTVYRWNNNPAIVRFSESDNIYNNLLLSIFVFSEESKENLVKILHNKIYEAIPKIRLSDISLATKSKIEEKGKKLWDEVINKTYKEVESYFDSDIRSKLLIHYAFDEEIEKKVKIYLKKYDIIVLDAAMLFKIGLDKMCHKIILVDASEDLRYKRLVKKRNITKEKAKNMIQSQKNLKFDYYDKKITANDNPEEIIEALENLINY